MGTPGPARQSPLPATDKIDQEKKEQKDIERHLRDLDNDLRKLNVLLSRSRSSSADLQQGSLVTQSSFVQALKVRPGRRGARLWAPPGPSGHLTAAPPRPAPRRPRSGRPWRCRSGWTS